MNINLKNSKLKNFYINMLLDFKDKIACFALFDNRIIEGNVYIFKNFSTVDIGFKYLIIEKTLLVDTVKLKVTRLESTLNDLHFFYIKLASNLMNWSLIKKAFANKCVLKGRILNSVQKGFSVGVFGFVGLVLQKNFFINKQSLRPVLGIKTVFLVKSIDYLKKTIHLSQSGIIKIWSRVLFRLSSQLAYISKK
jgi:ribosomal protein S1